MKPKGELFAGMRIAFDPAKSAANEANPTRGFGFELAKDFEFDTATIEHDDRRDYGEVRLFALGMIAARLHAIVFTIREDTLWVISLRKANERERKRYEQRADEGTGGRNRSPFPKTH
jgi:uncharacterized DUF497 family protein